MAASAVGFLDLVATRHGHDTEPTTDLSLWRDLSDERRGPASVMVV